MCLRTPSKSESPHSDHGCDPTVTPNKGRRPYSPLGAECPYRKVYSCERQESGSYYITRIANGFSIILQEHRVVSASAPIVVYHHHSNVDTHQASPRWEAMCIEARGSLRQVPHAKRYRPGASVIAATPVPFTTTHFQCADISVFRLQCAMYIGGTSSTPDLHTRNRTSTRRVSTISVHDE